MATVRSISGLRATYPDDLTQELIIKYCTSFAAIFPKGKIALGRDGRPSGKKIEEICCDIFTKLGRDVVLLGIVPTPTVQLITEKESEISCGIAITASHNPSQWNGLKFINGEGTFIDAEVNKKLWNLVDNFKDAVSATQQGKVINYNAPLKQHIEYIRKIALFDKELTEKIKAKNYKVVVDAVNASGSEVVPELLEEFGCEVIKLYCSGTGEFPHIPEPLPENLTELADAVKKHNADFGAAVDPDADRLVLIDENGNPIGEERTVCIAIDTVLKNYEKLTGYSKITTVNLSTTMLAERISESYGAKCTHSPVGEINVVNRMKADKSVIGGEGSGGIILPACHYGRDSLVGIALLLIHLTQNNTSLRETVSKLPKFDMLKTKLEFTGSIDEITDKIKEEFKDADIDLQDGIKIKNQTWWVQLRKSNTEPIIRIIAEGNDRATVENLINKVKGLISE